MASGEAAWFVEYASQLFHARPESYQKPAWKRKWKAHFGVSLRACLRVWLDIRGPRGLRRKHLLMALHMLQCYPSEEVAAPKFGVTAKTFRKWAWFVIERIAALDYVNVTIALNVYVGSDKKIRSNGRTASRTGIA